MMNLVHNFLVLTDILQAIVTIRRDVHLVCLLYCCVTLNGHEAHRDQNELNERAASPNIILFLADDLGWGDLAVFGHPTQEEGPIDQMAKEGIRFTQWYAAGPVCTPSRASLLTGRYPFRSGMYGETAVLLPGHRVGLPLEEITIAEALRDRGGYETGIVGKWHLGINEARYDDGHYLPHNQGFDYVGTILPFTLAWGCDTSKRHRHQPSRTYCLLYRNTTMVEQPIDLARLTDRLVYDAKEFLYGTRRSKPLFLYVSLPQPHTPMFNNHYLLNKSRRGIYGNQVNEMSWAVGEILDVIRELGIERNTLALFMSDHGPHREIGNEGGSTGPFAEGKGYYGEGGLRVPAIAWWPGKIRPGQVSADVVSLMDVFLTLLDVVGIPEQVTDKYVDGRSKLGSLLGTGSDDASNATLFFYCGQSLVAARAGRHKIYFRRSLYPSAARLARFVGEGGFPLVNAMCESCPSDLLKPWLVFDVETDPGELWPVSVEALDFEIIESLREALNSPKPSGEVRDGLLTRKNWHRGLVPCCNAPYCWCSDVGALQQCGVDDHRNELHQHRYDVLA